jgi:hypothetical protein
MSSDHVGGADEHEAAGSRRLDTQLIARLEPGPPQSIHGDGGLILLADSSAPPPASVLYCLHKE